MKKVLSILLIVCLLIQIPLPALAAIRDVTGAPTRGSEGGSTGGSTGGSNGRGLPGSEIRLPQPVKSDPGIFIEPAMLDEKLFTLSLAAAKFPIRKSTPQLRWESPRPEQTQFR
ncbi:MAG TPA: hypothetical protein VN370_06885 [Desulfitobacteriaceae bacterium]|jgi:hypothetical protein|nr:hypothetical protein [Desulfitobacteriaceae bacterium]